MLPRVRVNGSGWGQVNEKGSARGRRVTREPQHIGDHATIHGRHEIILFHDARDGLVVDDVHQSMAQPIHHVLAAGEVIRESLAKLSYKFVLEAHRECGLCVCRFL